jgi:hypothetical protein
MGSLSDLRQTCLEQGLEDVAALVTVGGLQVMKEEFQMMVAVLIGGLVDLIMVAWTIIGLEDMMNLMLVAVLIIGLKDMKDLRASGSGATRQLHQRSSSLKDSKKS